MPGLPTIAASPRRFPPTEPPPKRPGRRTAVVALAGLVAVLLAGALVGRLTTPRTPVLAAPASTGPSAVVATVPPVAPPPTSATSAPTALTRPADALAPWASRVGIVLDVPVVAVQAYGYAQLILESAVPDCHLGWTTLAGIGEVESQHGQAGGAVLDRDRAVDPADRRSAVGRRGTVGAGRGRHRRRRVRRRPELRPRHGTAADAARPCGACTRSTRDDDGIQDPYDIDDAALAVGRLLCAGGERPGQLGGWTARSARQQPGRGVRPVRSSTPLIATGNGPRNIG